MANTNLFKVSNFNIQFKDSRTLEMFATDALIPGLTLGELNIPRPVIRDLRNGDSLTYDDLIVSVICDEHLVAFKEIYDYIMKASDPNTADIDVVSPIFDSTLILTTNKNNIQHKVNFYNCFFKSIGAIQVSSKSTEEEHVTFDVSLGYSYYEFV